MASRRGSFPGVCLVGGMLALMSWVPGACQAESDYLQIAQRQLEAAEDGSFEQFEATLKLLEATYFSSLPDALVVCREANRLADALNDDNAKAICHMYTALLRGWRAQPAASKAAFQQAESLFDPETTNAFHRCHYYSAYVRYQFMVGEGGADIKHSLHNWLAAALATGDPLLAVQSYICHTFDLVILGGQDPDQPTVRSAIDFIKLTGPEVGLARDAAAFLSLMEACVANKLGDVDQAIAKLSEASETSKASGCAMAEWIHRSGVVDLLGQRGDWRSALPHLERILTLVRTLDSPRGLIKVLVKLSECHRHLGDLPSARKYLNEAIEIDTPNLAATAMLEQSQLYRAAIELAHREGDLDQVYRFASRMAAPEFLDKLSVHSANVRHLQDRIFELEEIQQSAQRFGATLQSEFSKSQAEAQREIRFLQVALAASTVAIAIPMLSIALLYSRRRLTQVRRELSKEKRSHRRDQRIRENLEQNIHRMQRMESLGILAGGVAHDFNNLLVGVICNAEILQHRQLDDELANDCVQQVIHAAEKAAGLSRQMLAYAGKQRIEKAPQDLNELTKQLFSVLHATVGKEVQINIEVSEQAQVASCDATQIEQVVLNLITNARDASKTGEVVILRTGREYIDVVDEEYLYGSRLDGGTFAFIEVEDSGSGIAQNSLEHIFEPFYSGRGTGRGLGLAVVYGIVEAHDGLIRVSSQPGVGTSVRILLPIAQTVAAVPTPTSPVESGTPTFIEGSTAPVVLVADDEPTVLTLSQRLLDGHGWEVLLARDGREAICELEKHRDRVCCLLLDVVMPMMDASAVLDELKRLEYDIPVVLMSGYCETQLDQYREHSQVVDIIEKPFRSSELISTLEALRERYVLGAASGDHEAEVTEGQAASA